MVTGVRGLVGEKHTFRKLFMVPPEHYSMVILHFGAPFAVGVSV